MEYLFEAKDISKRFGGTLALNHAKIQVIGGEVHALCGENGAGKSTLMNIIGGVFPPSEGILRFAGKEVTFSNPGQAQTLGIGFVHQELSLCPHMTAAENIFMGRLPHVLNMIRYKELYDQADEILQKFNAGFSSKKLVSDLNISEQQIVEIAKAVSQNCRLLILDEPTSSLTENETRKLMETIIDLKKQGISILYISHRLSEIFEVCDRVTVFKDGNYVKTMNIGETTVDEIISAMVGRKISAIYPSKASMIGKEMLRVEGLTEKGVFKDISFHLNQGEILGFAGLVGAGRSEIMRALCAIDCCDCGVVSIDGKNIKFRTYKDAISHGICYLTEDRKLQGLFQDMSIEDNMISANLKAVSGKLLLNRRKTEELSKKFIDRLNIKIGSLQDSISSLSGGNQQKCLVGKWLSLLPKILIMDEPTRGIDVGSKAEIHKLLRELADNGVGIIIVSSELPEVIGVSDRVVVICEGSYMGELAGEALTEENIMKLAAGKTAS